MDYIDIDVCGLSCPEPVILTMDAIDDNPGKTIRVTGNEAHTKTNIEKTLIMKKKAYELNESDNTFTFTIEA
ncbi:MAG: sulfurtransferase TusA family protein [Lachnospiraceae bacterium]|nr:sulfurtransferase TusA family protein [Lachnospiraceae bacterium]